MKNVYLILGLICVLLIAGCTSQSPPTQSQINQQVAQTANAQITPTNPNISTGTVPSIATSSRKGSVLVTDLSGINLNQNDVPTGAILNQAQSGLVTNALQYDEGNQTYATQLDSEGWVANYAVDYQFNAPAQNSLGQTVNTTTKTIYSSLSLYRNNSSIDCGFLGSKQAVEADPTDYTILTPLETHNLTKYYIDTSTTVDPTNGPTTTYEVRGYKYNVFVNLDITGTGRSVNQIEVENYLSTIESRIDQVCASGCDVEPTCTSPPQPIVQNTSPTTVQGSSVTQQPTQNVLEYTHMENLSYDRDNGQGGVLNSTIDKFVIVPNPSQNTETAYLLINSQNVGTAEAFSFCSDFTIQDSAARNYALQDSYDNYFNVQPGSGDIQPGLGALQECTQVMPLNDNLSSFLVSIVGGNTSQSPLVK